MKVKHNYITSTLGLLLYLIYQPAFQLYAYHLPIEVNCIDNLCDCNRIENAPFNIEQILYTISNGLIEDSVLIACTYHQIAIEYHYEFNDILNSLKYNKKAEKVRMKINDGLLWRSKLNIGLNYYDLNEYKKSLLYMENALKTNGPKSASDSVTIYRFIGECYMENGDFETAISFARKSINVSADQFEINLALNGYASILINSKDSINLIESIHYSKEALKSSQSIQDYENVETALNNLARANKILNILEIALSYYNEAIEMMDKTDTIRKAILFGNIATALNNLDLAIETQKKSLMLFRQYFETDFEYYYACNYENIADNYTALQQFDTALLHYQKALINLTNNFRNEDIHQNPNPKDTSLFIYSNPDIIRVLHLKATAAFQYYQKNDSIKYLTLANQTYQTAFNFHDKLQKDISTENSRLFQANNIVPYIENALKITYQQQENGQDISKAAFRFMEKNKATVLLQSMNEADALQFANLPDSLLDQEKDLKIAITYHKQQLNEAIEYEDTTETKRLDKILFDEKQQYSQLINNLEDNYPDYYRLKYQQNQTQVKEVQQSLDDQTALLEYFVGDSSIYILSIQKDHSNLYQIKKPANWKQIIDDFRTSITDSNNDEPELFVENADQLYQLLLNEPLCNMSEDIKRLQIIPDAELNYVPFEILLTEMVDLNYIQFKKLPYLFKQKSIGYAYSAALLLENKNNASTKKTWSYGGYAPIYYSNDSIFGDLPNARDTVISLAKSLNGQEFIEEQANLSNFINNTNSYKILHLAMHGVLNDKNPLSSYLAFTNTGSFKLHAYDLYNQKLNTDLTILHACNTGFGEIQKGEGVMSLSRAFTYAGCPSLVMSLWSIPEEATSKITSSFIHHLKNGLAKDVALQTAKINYLNNAHETEASPAYWAGLVATGNLNSIDLD